MHCKISSRPYTIAYLCAKGFGAGYQRLELLKTPGCEGTKPPEKKTFLDFFWVGFPTSPPDFLFLFFFLFISFFPWWPSFLPSKWTEKAHWRSDEYQSCCRGSWKRIKSKAGNGKRGRKWDHSRDLLDHPWHSFDQGYMSSYKVVAILSILNPRKLYSSQTSLFY